MSDLCYCKIYIEGDADTLHIIAERYNRGGGLESEIFASLSPADEGIECYSWWKAEVESAGDRAALSLAFTVRESTDREFWQEYAFDSDVFYVMDTIEGDDHWTNDVYAQYFNEPYFVAFVDDKGNEWEESFKTEEDAVLYVKEKCSSIPRDLKTLAEIDAQSINPLTFYCRTSVNFTCPPMIIKVINRLIDAKRIYSFASMADDQQ